MSEQKPKSRRGFASMDPTRMKAIASEGGKKAHARGRAHQWTSETGAEAGRKGGALVSRDKEHMSRIGVLGGRARAKRLKEIELEKAANCELQDGERK